MMKRLLPVLAVLIVAVSAEAQRRPAVVDATDRPGIDVQSYNVEITLVPASHQLKGVAEVKFKPLERMSYVTFDLDNRLHVDKVTLDGAEARYRQYDLDSTIEVSTAGGAILDVSTLRFEYTGFLDPQGDKRAPVLANISEDGAFLLYESKWFPTNQLYKDKAAASIKVSAPAGWTVVSDLPASGGGFASEAPSYWGMIAAGAYKSERVTTSRGSVNVHTLKAKSEDAKPMVEAAGKMLDFYAENFGAALQPNFQIVEAVGANWPSRWGVGALLMSSGQFRPDFDSGALARSLAHQWFPLKIAVADRDRDAWMADGLANFASLLYAEKNLAPAAYQEQVDKALVKALSGEGRTSTAEAGKLDRESPDYRALVEYKGAYIFRMLRWVVGDDKFHDIMVRYVDRFQNTPASTAAFEKLASDTVGEDLGYFFEQWLNDTGVPEMKADWRVLRVADGYRVRGEIRQDLDLFRMPVELEIETDGEPDYKRVDVAREASEFNVVTDRKPKAINIDPRKKILRLSPDIKVAVNINRGEEFMSDGRYNDAMDQFQDAIDMAPLNSLAAFRMGEALFELNNLNTAAQNFRSALNGDLKPKWVEVWSYINLGKIYDFRGDHERAVSEYQKAINTGDDAYGAQADAQKYIASGFRRGDRD